MDDELNVEFTDFDTIKAVKYLKKFKEHWCSKKGNGMYPCNDCPMEVGRRCTVNMFLQEYREDDKR